MRYLESRGGRVLWVSLSVTNTIQVSSHCVSSGRLLGQAPIVECFKFYTLFDWNAVSPKISPEGSSKLSTYTLPAHRSSSSVGKQLLLGMLQIQSEDRLSASAIEGHHWPLLTDKDDARSARLHEIKLRQQRRLQKKQPDPAKQSIATFQQAGRSKPKVLNHLQGIQKRQGGGKPGEGKPGN